MNSFESQFLDLSADIQQDMIMIPIQQLLPTAKALGVLEEMDSLIDHPYERHTDGEFVKKLVTDAMLKI